MTLTDLKTLRFYSLTASAAEVILTLGEKGELTMTALADELGVTTGGMTGIIDNLEKRKWLLRRSDADDRRAFRIALTEVGRVKYFQFTGQQAVAFSFLPAAPRKTLGLRLTR